MLELFISEDKQVGEIHVRESRELVCEFAFDGGVPQVYWYADWYGKLKFATFPNSILFWIPGVQSLEVKIGASGFYRPCKHVFPGNRTDCEKCGLDVG